MSNTKPVQGIEQQQATKSHSFFNTVANLVVAGYDKVADYVEHDTAKAVLVSQRSTFQKTVQAAAEISDKAVEAVSRGAGKLVVGDHHYQPDPLPNWLIPRNPIFSVQSSLPFIAVFGGLAVYHRGITQFISSPAHARSRYNILFFALPPENETEDPYQCGPQEGSFEPLFGKILWKTGILKREDLCATQSNNNNNATVSSVTASMQEEGREMTNVSRPRRVGGGSDTASSSGFDLLPDFPLGGTVVSGANSPRHLENSTKKNDDDDDDDQQQESNTKRHFTFVDDDRSNAASSASASTAKKNNTEQEDANNNTYTFSNLTNTLGNFLNLNNTTTVTAPNSEEAAKITAKDHQSDDGSTDVITPTSSNEAPPVAIPATSRQTQQQPQQQQQVRRGFGLAIRSIAVRTLEALHPNFVFHPRSGSFFTFSSYHFISFGFFVATAATSYIGLRKVAIQRGVTINSMLPTVARFARDVMPLSWTRDVIDRFGSQPADLASTLQFGLTLGTYGALLHLFSGTVEAVTGMFASSVSSTRKDLIDNKSREEQQQQRDPAVITVSAAANNSTTAPTTTTTTTTAPTTTTTTTTTGNKILRGVALASHYASLFLDLNLTLQLCVLSPSLPPIVKVFPALFFCLVTRKQYLCDDKHTKSYLGSHTRWILFAGALRHFAMLCESTPKNNNFLSHAFPRILSLTLLPIHLAAFWLPMNPVRAFDERSGGLFRTVFGFITGTAWSPGALAAANLAWSALYLTQGTSSMEDALPRIRTMNEISLPLPLYLISAEVLVALGKLLTNVA